MNSAGPSARSRQPLLARQLILARVREFTREPEAVFWAVFFPILLTTALGIAFGRGSVDVVPVVTSSAEVARALEAEPGLSVQLVDESAAQKMLLNGQAALFAQPGPDHGIVYRYDDTNPDGRAARLLADRAVQRAAGRVDPAPARDESGARAGQPLRGLRGSRPGRARHHEQRALGARVLDRRFAPAKAHEAPGRDADVADALPAVVPLLAHDDSRPSRSACRSGSACWRSAFRSADAC